jgi:hypothetical protein
MVVIEGLKAARLNINSTIAGLALAPVMRLVRSGDSGVRLNAWRVVSALQEFDRSTFEQRQEELLEVFQMEANLDVVEGALEWIDKMDSRIQEQHCGRLVQYLIENRMLPVHPVLLRRLLKLGSLRTFWNDKVLESVSNQTEANLSWAAVWLEILKADHFFKLSKDGRKLVIICLLESDDDNVVYAGLELLKMSASSMGEEVLAFQHILGRLLNHEDLQITHCVYQIFFEIVNAENWRKIVGLALDRVRKPVGLEARMLSMSTLKLAMRATLSFAEEELDVWIQKILVLVPEGAELQDINEFKSLLPDSTKLTDPKLNRVNILTGLVNVGDCTEKEELYVRSNLLEGESNPLVLISNAEVHFREGLFTNIQRIGCSTSSPGLAETAISSPSGTTPPPFNSIPPELMTDIFTGFQKGLK